MEACISAFYHISPREQLALTTKQWVNLWNQIPHLRAEESMRQANIIAYPLLSAEARHDMWTQWQLTIEQFMAYGKRMSVRSMVEGVRSMLRKAHVNG